MKTLLNIKRRNLISCIAGVFSITVYADPNSNVHLHACVYSTSTVTTPVNYEFKHISNYCMINPGRNDGDSSSLKVTVTKQGMNCSDGYNDAAYEWNDSAGSGAWCYSSISYSSFLFSSDTDAKGGMLYWGGYGSKGLLGNQLFFEGDSNLFQLCTMAGICNRKSGGDNTVYYGKNSDLYLIYTPNGA